MGTFLLLMANHIGKLDIKFGDNLVRAFIDTEATLLVLNANFLFMFPPWNSKTVQMVRVTKPTHNGLQISTFSLATRLLVGTHHFLLVLSIPIQLLVRDLLDSYHAHIDFSQGRKILLKLNLGPNQDPLLTR